MRIAVVGAGIGGLAASGALVERGHRVVVFEAADHPGGRVASRRTEVGGFDTGAQYLTARDPAFVARIDAWRRDGCIAPWRARVATLGDAGARAPSGAAAPTRWVGTPSMADLPARMATGLDVRCGTRVVRLDPVDAADGPTRWSLVLAQGDPTTVADDPFDAVLIALPAARATALLDVAPSLQARVGEARIEPCWALLLAFVEPVFAADAACDAAFVASGRLAWIAREDTKPDRRIGERWTAHAQSAWSVEHFDDDPEDVKAKLLHAFQEATGTSEQPVYAQVVRWREALPRAWLSVDCLWDADRAIGVCGDWCRGYRVEDAWLSGAALAKRVDAHVASVGAT